MFQGGKELQASGYLAVNHYEAQLAYSIDSNKAAIASVYVGLNGFKYDFGLGYLKKLKNNYSYEIYGGAGMGSAYGKEPSIFNYFASPNEISSIQSDYWYYYIQQNYGHKHFGLTAKLQYLNYSYYSYMHESYDPIHISDSVKFSNHAFFVFTPAITAKYWKGNFKFITQLSISMIPFGEKTFKGLSHPIYNPFLVSTGFQLILDFKRKTKKKSL